MKISFIFAGFNAFNHKDKKHIYPLSQAVLKSLTPDNIETEFFDNRFEDIPEDLHTDLVAISVETYNALKAYKIANIFRSKGIPVIMGGIQTSLISEEVLEHADSIVIGSAETLWNNVLSDFKKGMLKRIYEDQEDIKDLIHIKPDRSIFKNKEYHAVDVVETARGCPHHCNFCSVAKVHNGNYCTKKIDKIVEDLSGCKTQIYFADDNFVANPKRTIEICKSIAPLKKRWMAEGSVTIAKSPDLMKALNGSGCACLLLGLESLNPKTLMAMGKSWNGTIEYYRNSIARMRDHGIAVYGSFVFGYDHDTVDDIKRTVEFAIEEKLLHISLNQLVPFPDTPLYLKLKNEGRLINKKWWLDPDYISGEPLTIPKLMKPEEMLAACRKYRNEFYSYSSVIKRMMDFKANCKSLYHLAFFLSSNLGGLKSSVVQDN